MFDRREKVMELKVFNYNVGYIKKQNNQLIILGFHNSKKDIEVDQNLLEKDETILYKINRSDALLAIIKFNEGEYYIHIKNKYLICTRFINGNTKGSINLKIKYYDDRFKLIKTKYNYTLKDSLSDVEFELNYRIFEISHNIILKKPERKKNEKNIYVKIRYLNYYNFIEYTKRKNEITLKTTDFSTFNNSEISISLSSRNKLNISTQRTKQQIKISDLLEKKHLIMDSDFKSDLTFPIFIRVGKRMFVIIKNSVNNNIYIKYNSRINLILKYSEYNIDYKNNKFIIYGLIKYKENPYPDAIMAKSGKVLSKLKWIDSEKFVAEIKMSDIINLPLIHNTLYLSKNNEFLIPLKRYNIDKIPSAKIVYKTKVYKNKVLVSRLNLVNNISLTVIPKLPVYNYVNKIKINIAYKISEKFKWLFPKKINLYFEKEASKIGESGSYVFEEVMKLSKIKSHNYFILDKNSKDFKSMKKKWKSNLITRFSFKHYLYIFLAKSFISSELSSHVISGRLFEDKLNQKIKKTPLYFLQHGIMFAKPVDNPMAAGFHKKNMMNNVVKNVISSDLEAEQFYRMGYDDNDLMKTGLPKFDGAYLNKDADKITYMPTWRYWEEAEILNGNITNTTYYESFIKLIQSFEKANLLDSLQITAHNKFSEFIAESLPQYKSIICEDPSEALTNSKIFITDYSSIIYDAIFRGAYPIFYWKDKDYLIENYQAIPPVNDQNAPGKIAYSEEELIKHVKSAIDKDFLIEDENLKKYRMINEFYDRQNSNRVINILKKNNIL